MLPVPPPPPPIAVELSTRHEVQLRSAQSSNENVSLNAHLFSEQTASSSTIALVTLSPRACEITSCTTNVVVSISNNDDVSIIVVLKDLEAVRVMTENIYIRLKHKKKYI
jgi:hypothetical protein